MLVALAGVDAPPAYTGHFWLLWAPWCLQPLQQHRAKLLQPFLGQPGSTHWQRGSCGSPLFILFPNECSSCREPVTQVEIPNKFSPPVWGQLVISWQCHHHMRQWHRGAAADFHHPESWDWIAHKLPVSLSSSPAHISIPFPQTDLLAKPPRSENNCLSATGYEALFLPGLSLKT